MKRIIAILISFCMMFVFCSCGDSDGSSNSSSNEKMEFEDLQFDLDSSDWTLHDLNELVNEQKDAGEDGLAKVIASYDMSGEEEYVNQTVVDNYDAPDYMYLYCMEIAGTDTVTDISYLKENIKNSDEEYTEMKDLEVGGVKAFEYAYENETGELNRHVVSFIANSHFYRLLYSTDKDGNMDSYASTFIDSISVKEDTSKTNFTLGDMDWTLTGKWKSDDDDFSDVSDEEDFIAGVSKDSAGGDWVYALTYNEETPVDKYYGYLEEPEGTELIDKEEAEVDGIGKIYIGYFKHTTENDSVFYSGEIVVNRNNKTYTISMTANSIERAMELVKEYKKTVVILE